MSFISGGDIVSAVKLAAKIYEYGFDEENAADVRYKIFQNDISNFRYLLEKLNDALRQAQQRYNAKARLARLDAYDPLSDDFEKERKTIVGNFLETLKSCDKLLAENKEYRQRYSNFPENLAWHLFQQERRVDELRTRLNFHSEKIRLVIDRLSITLLTDADAKIDDIMEITEQTLHVSNIIHRDLLQIGSTLSGHLSGRPVSVAPKVETVHAVSGSIASKFQRFLLVDAPASTASGIPLAQGFDALLLAFEQSISSSDCTPECYLSFLKARWLLECLGASKEYRAARPGFYYKRAVNTVSRAIATRMQEPGALISYDESVLMDLPDTHFRILTPSDPIPGIRQSEPHPLMVRAGEEELVRVTLAPIGTSEPDTVVLFKRSEEHFRIVRQTILPSRPDEKVLTHQQVYIQEDKLIPRYALPTINDADLEIAIFSRNEETLYKFDTYESLFRFQSALSGYEVSHDQPDIHCQFSRNAKHLDCKGRAQLWQEPIGSPKAMNELQHAPRTPSTLSDGTHSRYDSLAVNMDASQTIRRTPEGFEAESIKLPAFTIFTQLTDARRGKRLAILFVELEPGVFIDPKGCDCCHKSDTCLVLVLTNKKSKTGISIRALFSNVDYTGHSGFDLLPFRMPRHLKNHKLTQLDSEYLMLTFDRLADKRRFEDELGLRFRVRDRQMQKQQDFTRQVRRLESQRPLHRTATRQHERSASDASRRVSLPHHLEVSVSDTRLDTSFIRGIGSDESFSKETSVHASPKNDSTRNTTQDLEKESSHTFRTSPSGPVARRDPSSLIVDTTSSLHTTSPALNLPQRAEERQGRSSAASGQTASATLQADLPTSRKKDRDRHGFWRNFKP